jgi:F0F1-type ATP synthase delta subunit
VQPTIIAGCTLRTSNKFYDFSLRSHFTKAESLLQKEVRAL